MVVDDVLIEGDCNGVLHAYDVSEPGEDPPELWTVELGGCIESTPAVWNGPHLRGHPGRPVLRHRRPVDPLTTVGPVPMGAGEAVWSPLGVAALLLAAGCSKDAAPTKAQYAAVADGVCTAAHDELVKTSTEGPLAEAPDGGPTSASCGPTSSRGCAR